MSSKFAKAVVYAANTINFYKDAFPFGESLTRSLLLGIHKKDFDWEKELKDSKTDFDAFDRTKRYCSHLMRKEEPLPEPLKLFVTAYLDDVFLPPKKKRGSPKKGRELEMFLPQLIHRITIEFNLAATRNYESEIKESACDAVNKAINQQPNPKPKILKAGSYDMLSKSYIRAKKQGSLVG